ncbi:jg6342 [Pararge aegeria aegeria]|uniref:Jg6342 protein n=1 Tax=Pararge aegeria aegeria TaxID=348720 RepID=A0A8S4RTA9_9NEOP|nr:jg6342 [Pararge aegeria aegeria]
MRETVRLTSNRAEVRVLEGGIHLSTSPTSPPDVDTRVSSHDELPLLPHSPYDPVANPQVAIGKCPSEK